LAIFDYTSTPGGDRMALGLCLVSIGLALTVLVFNEGLIKRFRRGAHR
jgi:molybdate transport system permease protein